MPCEAVLSPPLPKAVVRRLRQYKAADSAGELHPFPEDESYAVQRSLHFLEHV